MKNILILFKADLNIAENLKIPSFYYTTILQFIIKYKPAHLSQKQTSINFHIESPSFVCKCLVLFQILLILASTFLLDFLNSIFQENLSKAFRTSCWNRLFLLHPLPCCHTYKFWKNSEAQAFLLPHGSHCSCMFNFYSSRHFLSISFIVISHSFHSGTEARSRK